jgi:fatty-acyl-CoA synthase
MDGSTRPIEKSGTQMTMAEAFRAVATSRLKQEALVCGETRLTYGRLLEGIEALARGLHGLGIRKGDVVAALLTPGPDYVRAFFALAHLGAVFVPLSPQVRPRGMRAVLQDAGPVALIAQRAVEQEVLDAAGTLRHVISADESIGSPNLADLMLPGSSVSCAGPSSVVSPDDLLALLYTSGTTGTPKGTMHTHRSLIAPVAASIKLRELWLKRPNLATIGKMAVALARYRERLLRAAGRPQCFLSTTSWHTVTGLEVMLQALLMGDRLVVMPRFHPREAFEWIERERVTVLIAVPTALQVMLSVHEAAQREASHRDDSRRYDTSSLLICGTGAAPCPPRVARGVQERFGCAIHIGFGATETGGGISATSLADSDERQAGTVGQPMPGIEVRVVDEERCELPRGEVGELACRSDSVMLGYYRAPEATARVIDEEGWYYTGDLARIDEDGYVHIVGRIKDLIIRGGQNIYPAEIETFLAAHPKVREAAVVGIPAAVGGERVCAFVRLEEGAEMTAREVLAYCRQELEAFKIPSQVRFLDDFPRTETGKIKKFELRRAYLATEAAENTELV